MNDDHINELVEEHPELEDAIWTRGEHERWAHRWGRGIIIGFLFLVLGNAVALYGLREVAHRNTRNIHRICVADRQVSHALVVTSLKSLPTTAYYKNDHPEELPAALARARAAAAALNPKNCP